MSASTPRHLISSARFDAVLFDLDGVITATARNHFAAWKKVFDSYLRTVARRDGVPFRPFDEADMRDFVDGKPRDEGIRSFLESRGIDIPFGDPGDPEDAETVCGLGNRKNRFFNDSIEAEGVDVFRNSLGLLKSLRADGVRCAVVSSSKNCRTVLDAAGIADLFDITFDGNDAAEMGLTGKPNPDTYLEAAERIGAKPARAVVVEDAISGVQAGRAGGFGLVIGVDRTGITDALIDNGADVVVKGLGELLV